MHAQFVCIYAWVEGRSACCLAKGPRAGGGPGGQPGLRRGVLEASRVTGMMVTARVVKLPLRAYSCSRLSSPPQARNGKKSQHVVTVFFLPSLRIHVTSSSHVEAIVIKPRTKQVYKRCPARRPASERALSSLRQRSPSPIGKIALAVDAVLAPIRRS